MVAFFSPCHVRFLGMYFGVVPFLSPSQDVIVTTRTLHMFKAPGFRDKSSFATIITGKGEQNNIN